jgi:hypothetical protein
MDSQIAKTIVEQLGGLRMISMMIGIKHILTSELGVDIRFKAKAAHGCNHINISLDQSTDTYIVTFWRIPRALEASPVELSQLPGVHADQLRSVIENYTHLRLAL